MTEHSWGLHHGSALVARLETGADMPWTYAAIEELPGFESVRSLLADRSARSLRETSNASAPLITGSARR